MTFQINQSDHIDITDCVNINITQLKAIHSRLVLHDTLKSTLDTVEKALNNVKSDAAHYCGWINDRILGNCDNAQNMNYGLRDALNDICTDERPCYPTLCTIDSVSS